MARSLSAALKLPVALAFLFLTGCGDESPDDVAPNVAGPPGKGSPGAGPGQAARSNPKIKAIMTKVGKGPQSLQDSLKEALKQGEHAWDTIQPKSQEYAQLTSELGKLEPVRGDKDSWAKLTLAFAESATELELAAQAKDMNKTKESLDTLGSSCMACHRQHRVMGGPGMGGPPGGRGMGGFPGGRGMGPPPGGPGGPPTGGPPPDSGGPPTQ
jgi:cytochrome c556